MAQEAVERADEIEVTEAMVQVGLYTLREEARELFADPALSHGLNLRSHGI